VGLLPGRSNSTLLAATATLLIVGCGGGGQPTTVPAHRQARVTRLSDLRLDRAGRWHRVPMEGIVGADHMLTLASLAPHGADRSLEKSAG
jgi:hypothetical protein